MCVGQWNVKKRGVAHHSKTVTTLFACQDVGLCLWVCATVWEHIGMRKEHRATGGRVSPRLSVPSPPSKYNWAGGQCGARNLEEGV